MLYVVITVTQESKVVQWTEHMLSELAIFPLFFFLVHWVEEMTLQISDLPDTLIEIYLRHLWSIFLILRSFLKNKSALMF